MFFQIASGLYQNPKTLVMTGRGMGPKANVMPPSQQNSLGSSDQDFDSFVDIDIKNEPDVPGMEIFDEAKEPSQVCSGL